MRTSPCRTCLVCDLWVLECDTGFLRLDQVDEAIQLLKAMFGFNWFSLPLQWAKPLAHLASLGFTFTATPLNGSMLPVLLAAAGLVIILGFKNTFEKMEAFRPSVTQAMFTIVLLICSILNLTKVSSFYISGSR